MSTFIDRMATTPRPQAIDCQKCDDEAACSPEHAKAKVACRRCAGTGAFITRVENGTPKGPGGPCFRCAGKGFHNQADRKRNADFERYGRRIQL